MSLPPPRKSFAAPPPRIKPPQNQPSAIHIQNDLAGVEAEQAKSNYTSKIKAPIYEPKNKRPDVFELVDQTKVKKLIARINAANISESDKKFLIAAASRHSVFNYKKIADYYAHAPKEVQVLMEDSALVIIDFADAIQKGYVKFSEEIANIYVKEHGKTE